MTVNITYPQVSETNIGRVVGDTMSISGKPLLVDSSSTGFIFVDARQSDLDDMARNGIFMEEV